MGEMQQSFVEKQKLMAENNQKNLARVQEENQKFTDGLIADFQAQQEEFQAQFDDLNTKYVDTLGKLTECENNALYKY